jgi:DNA-binding transcriptional ArsR family regulator
MRVLVRAGGAAEGIQSIAEAMGASRDAVSRKVRDAERAGLIDVERRGGKAPIRVSVIDPDWLQRIVRSDVGNYVGPYVGPMSAETRHGVSDMADIGVDLGLRMSETSCMSETPDIAPDQDVCYVGNPPLPTEGGLHGVGPPSRGDPDEPAYEGLI